MKTDLLADTDLCVKCGLCLPYCPTYGKTQNENDSPRGRIALIEAWAQDRLPANEALNGHIDGCLLCRSCERVCPAQVPYGQLIDNFRDQVGTSGLSWPNALLKRIISNDRASRVARSLLDLYLQSGIQKLSRSIGLTRLMNLQGLDRLLGTAEKLPVANQNFYPAINEYQGDVGLFRGCMDGLLDHETVISAVEVLNHAGFNVHIPEAQGCCGALHLHGGNKKVARQLAEKNSQAYTALSLDAVISVASGCGAVLQEYQDSSFSEKVLDISQFLRQKRVLETLPLKPLPAKLMLHTPCSLKNSMRPEQGVKQLLEAIPEIEISELPESMGCCGSAGSYMLEHPVMAKALLDDLLQIVKEKKPDYLLSSNIGCILHIAAGLREMKLDIEILHPVVMIRRLLVERLDN